VERSAEQHAEIAALAEKYDALVGQWGAVEDLPGEVEARLKELDASLEAWGDGTAFDPDDIARGGVFVILGHDGQIRIERGLIRRGDAKTEPEPESDAEIAAEAEAARPPRTRTTARHPARRSVPEEPDDLTPLSERLLLDLTALARSACATPGGGRGNRLARRFCSPRRRRQRPKRRRFDRRTHLRWRRSRTGRGRFGAPASDLRNCRSRAFRRAADLSWSAQAVTVRRLVRVLTTRRWVRGKYER
jgi:hypothetical protein